MIETIIKWVHETAASDSYNFVEAAAEIDQRVSTLGKEDILELVEEIHVIPESFNHDSTEEKVYTKASDSIVAASLRHLGFTAKVLAERGDAADVISQSRCHSYSLVADSKVFRLSRTAKNQKDFKIDSMNLWRGDCDYAVVVAPYYQYPSRKSAIYQKSVANNVALIGFEHLGFLLRSGVAESRKQSFARLFSYPIELQNELSVANSAFAVHSRDKLREVALEITGASKASYDAYIDHFLAKVAERAGEEIAFWTSEIAKIEKMSHKEAIQALIDARKIRSKIETIRAFMQEVEELEEA